MLTKRGFFRTGAAFTSAGLLSGCVPVLEGIGTGTGALGAGFRPQPNADYDAWVAAFRGRALAEGITSTSFERAFRGAGYLPGVIERDRNQTEFRRSTED